MLNIKVLGPGCRKCHLVEQMAAAGLLEFMSENPILEATLEHSTDLLAIEQYPILSTPALVINEKVVCAGRIPNKQEVLGWFKQAIQPQV